MLDALRNALFPGDDEKTYAVIDGASCEELLEKLDAFKPGCFCLYAGELAPDVREVAPHLVELLPDHPFTEWLFAEGFGKHWCIFARASADLQAMRRHFRTLLLVNDPDGKRLYFRYYDPRVLRVYLPTCTPEEARTISGPITRWICEAEDPNLALVFGHEHGTLESSSISLV